MSYPARRPTGRWRSTWSRPESTGRAAQGWKLLCFSGAGFTPELRRRAATATEVELVDLSRLYTGG